jgi:glycerate kinase
MQEKNILIAPDSFKGSLCAADAAKAIAKGFSKAGFNNTTCAPMADGGEGTVEAMIAAVGGNIISIDVNGPMGDKVRAFYGILEDKKTAIIEMASASGLPLVKGEKNPLIATSYGTGELMLDAVKRGCNKIIMGLGGSATNDGGSGMARALGIRFLDALGHDLPEGGEALINLDRIDMSDFESRFNNVNIQVACDVDNPLCGANGATAVYGPQKGATPKMVTTLDDALKNYARIIKRDIGNDIQSIPGSGAAGGLGGGLCAFAGAELKRGVDIVMSAIGMNSLISKADIVVTGEGQTDFQTAFGKVPAGIASLCKKHGKPLICLSGSLGENCESLYDIGITSLFSICNKPMTLEYAIENAENLLTNLAQNVARLYI